MTEAAGLPGPAERFSSLLPIRVAGAAMATGADGSNLIKKCDMARAFGTGRRLAETFGCSTFQRNRTGTSQCLPPEPSQPPRQAFRIASQPARPGPDR